MKVYVVKNGRKNGIYNSWGECEEQVKGFPNAVYKSFSNLKDAQDFYYESINMKNEDYINIDEITDDIMIAYIDGSYDSNLNIYSYASIIFFKKEKIEIYDNGNEIELLTMRNVAGEIKAALETIKYGVNNNVKKIYIYYDYLGIEKWYTGEWKSNNNLTQYYSRFAEDIKKSIDIKFIKVKSHSGNKYNEEVDKLAKKALRKSMHVNKKVHLEKCKINNGVVINPVFNIILKDQNILNTSLLIEKIKDKWKQEGNRIKEIEELRIGIDTNENIVLAFIKTKRENKSFEFDVEECFRNEQI